MSRIVEVTSNRWNTKVEIPTTKDWASFAKQVKQHLQPGNVLALRGELGAGKTTFVQALARELGIRRVPQSPTFALMRSYTIPGTQKIQRLIHVDAYRLEDESEMRVLDLDEELTDGKSILVVEWAEKIPGWIQRHAVQFITFRIQLS